MGRTRLIGRSSRHPVWPLMNPQRNQLIQVPGYLPENNQTISDTAMTDETPNPQDAVEAAGSETSGTTPSTEADWLDALRQVIDPELMVNIVDLGLVYSVAADDEVDQGVAVEMTLTSPACPAGPQIVQQAKMALERLHDVSQAMITMTMSPPWTPERMTDDARDQLGIF